jgi:hypothetical protein
MSQGKLINNGIVNLNVNSSTSTTLVLNNSSTVTNLGTFNLGDSAIIRQGAGPTDNARRSSIVNTGTFVKSTGAGTAKVLVLFTQTAGSVRAAQGVLKLPVNKITGGVVGQNAKTQLNTDGFLDGCSRPGIRSFRGKRGVFSARRPNLLFSALPKQGTFPGLRGANLLNQERCPHEQVYCNTPDSSKRSRSRRCFSPAAPAGR